MAKYIVDLVIYDTEAEIPTTGTAGQMCYAKDTQRFFFWESGSGKHYAAQYVGATYLDLQQLTTPANPASGTRRLFVDSADGKFKVRTSGGSSVSLEESGGSSDHATLTNVLSDQHHASSHTHASHSGIGASDHHGAFVQADHDALANPHHSSANDHAASHTLASHSVRAHSDLTGIAATDHHSNANDHAATLDHARLHSIIGVSDHNGFPGGTTNFLRADGAFAAPPGGGGAWTTKIKLADQTNNSATLADDDTLQFTTLPNTNYIIRLEAFFLTNATQDSKYRMVHTGTTTRVRRRIVQTTTTDIALEIATKTAFDGADVVLSTTGANPFLEEYIILQVGASGGVFKLQWAQVTGGAGPTQCLEGSYLEYAIT